MSLPGLLTTVIVGLAALAGMVRLAFWQRRTAYGERGPRWRFYLLLLLQPLAATLLYFTLYPPPRAAVRGSLTIATGGTGLTAAALAAGPLLVLPEADPRLAGEPVPDLATALRRYGRPADLVVLGDGLEPRDRNAARGLPLRFTPPAATRGFIRLVPPVSTAPGARFQVGGAAAGLAGGRAELLDPAGQRVDTTPIDEEGSFLLSGSARAAGTTLFSLQLKDSGGRMVEQAAVPLWTRTDPAPRLLILAGAPGPEVKYLRRWATDSGMAVSERVAVGSGLFLTAQPQPLTSESLRRTDLAIVDERSWIANRAPLIAAVRNGMGLLIRADCPASGGARQQWAGLGMSLSPGNTVESARLASAMPVTRCAARVSGTSALTLTRDADGKPLAIWRAVGRGRVGLTTILDSFALALAGRPDLHGELWSGVALTLLRPLDRTRPELIGEARVATRAVLCGVHDRATVMAPQGGSTPLQIDPAAGPRRCAAFWPTTAGWHRLRWTGGEQPFWVTSADANPGIRRAEIAEATLGLVGQPARRPGTPIPPAGPSWPWLLALLATLGVLWWLERHRRGRATSID